MAGRLSGRPDPDGRADAYARLAGRTAGRQDQEPDEEVWEWLTAGAVRRLSMNRFYPEMRPQGKPR